jgi:Cyclin, C-terminal domain
VEFRYQCLAFSDKISITQVANIVDSRELHFAMYLVELSLIEYSMLGFKYSTIATASVYLTGRVFARDGERNAFPLNLRRHSGLTEEKVLPCAATLLYIVQNAHTNNLKAVYKKYSSAKLSQVSAIPIPDLAPPYMPQTAPAYAGGKENTVHEGMLTNAPRARLTTV